MSILIHCFALTMLTGFFMGIYHFSDKSLARNSSLKDSFILAQSCKLKNASFIQHKYRIHYFTQLNQHSQKISTLKNGNKIETQLINPF